MSLWLIIGVSAYVIITIGFLTAIQFERQKQEVDFNLFQVIVPFFWFLWLIGYLYTVIANKIRNG